MKQLIREEYKKIREKIENKEEKAISVIDKVIKLDEYKNAKNIAVFKSFGSEIDTNRLIEYSIKNGKIVALPRVSGKNIFFYRYKLDDELVLSKFGVMEPKKIDENYISKETIDLVIVPGLCFDKTRNRIGYGGGFYDKFLAGFKRISIGICFDEQLYIAKLPTTPNDKKVGILVTDKKIYR